MNFSIERCVHLAKLQLAGNRKLYLYTLAALAGILLSFMLYYVFYNRFGLHHTKQAQIFGTGWLIFTIVAATWHFHSISAQSTRLQSLMLPVTAGERIAVAIFFNGIVFPVLYIFTYFLSSGLAYYIDASVMHHFNYYFNYFVDAFDTDDNTFFKMLFLAMSLGLTAGIVFRKLAIVKVFACITVIMVSTILLSSVIGKSIFSSATPPGIVLEPNNGKAAVSVELLNESPFSDWWLRSKSAAGITVDHFTVVTPAYMETLWIGGVMFIYVGLLAVIYFRLKEQQV